MTRIEPIARNMRLVRVESDEIARLAWTPGQHVRVHVGDRRDRRSWLWPRDALRAYSVWNHDGGLELCVFDHDTGGPGARWVRALRTGQRVTFGRPEGSFTLRDAPYHVFAGEETAAVAFGAMLRALPPGAPAYGVIEVDGPGDRLPLARDLHWEYRGGRSAAASETLVEAVHRLELRPAPASPTWPERPAASRCCAGTWSPNAAGRARPSAPNPSGLPDGSALTSLFRTERLRIPS